MVAFVPGCLGATAYGQFTFATQFYQQLISLLECGSSQAFFTKLSQKNDEFSLIKFYSYYVLMMVLFVIFLTQFIFLVGKSEILFPNQSILYLYLGLFYSFGFWISQVFVMVSDAYALTTISEKCKIIHRTLFTFILVILIYNIKLDLKDYYIFLIIQYVVFICMIYYILKIGKVIIIDNIYIKIDLVYKYIYEFYSYCHPLFIYLVVSMVTNYYDLWLIQKFYGSHEQGYYSFGFQISRVCFLFTMSMTPLITREYSIAYAATDYAEMKKLFYRYIPMMYTLSTIFSVFIFFSSENIIRLIAGKSFESSISVLMIISFYPMHQTYGQLCSTMYYATGKMKEYRNIVGIIMIIGTILSSFLLLPKEIFGYELGSFGLAIKVIITSIITANIMIYHNLKIIKGDLWRIIFHQIYVPVIICSLGYLSNRITLIITTEILKSLIINFMIYMILCLCFIMIYPSCVSMDMKEINILKKKIKSIFWKAKFN